VETTATHSPEGRYEKIPIFSLAAAVLLVAIGAAFAAGWLIGRILL
jgi:hypothetical protein